MRTKRDVAAALFRLMAKLRSRDVADHPRLVDRLPGSRILCLAPHPDDETLGCGGTLRKHVLAGDEVFVAFLNDGGRGHPGAASRAARADCARRRMREARAALEVLGVARSSFFGLPDGRLGSNLREAAKRLTALLDAFPADIVCFPHPFDNHPDHRVVFDVAVHAATSAQRNVLFAAYEVWTPVAANTLVDITQEMDVKEAALRKYESQMAALGHIERFRGLNAYRSLSLANASRHAEAFYVSPWREFRALIERVRRGS